MEIIEGVIGKKGEIYVKKKLRKLLNLKPGDKVEFIIKDDIVLFRKKPSPVDLLRRKKVKVDIGEIMHIRKKFEEEMTSGT